MEPTEALMSLETGLRQLIQDRIGSGWLDGLDGSDRGRLERGQENDARSRPGVVVSGNLLDYTMTYQLLKIVLDNWAAFEPVFVDRERFTALLGVVVDLRNTVAHSRQLLPFERDLLVGVTGYVSNLVTLYRGSNEHASSFYPLIESLTDHLGNDLSRRSQGVIDCLRLDVGTTLRFRATSTATRDVELIWKLAVGQGVRYDGIPTETRVEASGSAVDLEYTIGTGDVHERFWVEIALTTRSDYHRHSERFQPSYDDMVTYFYPIRPPHGR